MTRSPFSSGSPRAAAPPHEFVRHRSVDPLIAALRDPSQLAALPLSGWSPLIRRARRAGLLGRLASLLTGRLDAVPEQPRQHLEAALILAEKHRRDVAWEVRCIRDALAPLDLPIILLKGGAYAIADLPPAKGRMFGDIDILVPRRAIRDVERNLIAAGWQPSEVDRWDERFYREWMHQIPPLVHAYRDTLVDVHHTIVPPTARVNIAPEKLVESARPIAGNPGLLTLAPADMVVHSATHLFNEGEWGRGLRDLVDLDALLRHFGTDPEFWPTLVARAHELDLARPVHYALRYTERLLGTPVPPTAAAALGGPGVVLRPVMDALFERALLPDDLDDRGCGRGPARFALYVRGHWLRLPPRLLVPHLLRKASLRLRGT
jgi:hypothetical protein